LLEIKEEVLIKVVTFVPGQRHHTLQWSSLWLFAFSFYTKKKETCIKKQETCIILHTLAALIADGSVGLDLDWIWI